MGICASSDESGDKNNTLVDIPAQVAPEVAVRNKEQALVPLDIEEPVLIPLIEEERPKMYGANPGMTLTKHCVSLDSNQFDNMALG